MAVLHQPNGRNKKIKRVCRLVVLPDYQGIGIGMKFLSIMARYYSEKGFDFSIVTSAKNLIHALLKNKSWILQRYSESKKTEAKTKKQKSFSPSIRSNCKTASFFYKKERG